jgi:predicted Rossmann fold flavoprotein
MAGIFAGRGNPGLRIALLDGAKKLGAKILISGGGRCNVTHDVVRPEDFNGNQRAIAKVLRTFSVEQTIEFFGEIGVRLKREETGKLFPVTDRAESVLRALTGAAREAGVEIVTGYRVSRVLVHGGASFVVFAAQNDRGVEASRVILATGGGSVPKTGSDGHGYEIARSLGHSVTSVFPALVPLVIEEDHWIKRASGTSADVELSVASASGRMLRRERGSLLFTHFGISGPVALDISRHWIAARAADRGVSLLANFLPGETFESLERLIVGVRNPRATIPSLLRGRVPERVLRELAPDTPMARLARPQRREAIRRLMALPLPVLRDRGFDYAEVTAGGVPLAEIDLSTMESRATHNLFLCGEILDVDGKIGGYNFQWAWASGRLAGIGAARG